MAIHLVYILWSHLLKYVYRYGVYRRWHSAKSIQKLNSLKRNNTMKCTFFCQSKNRFKNIIFFLFSYLLIFKSKVCSAYNRCIMRHGKKHCNKRVKKICYLQPKLSNRGLPRFIFTQMPNSKISDICMVKTFNIHALSIVARIRQETIFTIIA